jgi:Zn finger protein HypA/HybF involved in hydrogenase expression
MKADTWSGGRIRPALVIEGRTYHKTCVKCKSPFTATVASTKRCPKCRRKP